LVVDDPTTTGRRLMDDITTTAKTPSAIRARARAGRLTGHTAGLADGFVQANIAILPAPDAADFADYCRSNAQACPVLAMSEPGDPRLPTLGGDIDIRHDLPRYRVYRDGVVGETGDIAALWRDDLVTFAIGCSFTFDNALLGRFGGKLVVSMRPLTPADAARATEISAAFADQHGAPIHAGDPSALGIDNIAQPEYGDPVPIEDGETPVFWACGVTSQSALQHAGLAFFIAHAPGCMLVTDRRHGR
jgi:uncharacterized protein YcsI (UPF0317 family)